MRLDEALASGVWMQSKATSRRISSLRFVLLFAVVTTCVGTAQDITGTWISAPGTASRSVVNGVGRSRWVLQLSKDGQGQLSGRMWRQQAEAIATPFSSLSWDGSKLSFSIKLAGLGTVSFVGVLSEDGNWVDGWMISSPLKLERVPHLRNRKAGIDKPETTAASTGRTTPTAPMTTPPLAMTPASESESSAGLSRALAKLAGTSHRLLKYACLETVERSYYNEPAPKLGAHPMSEASADSCNAREFNDDSQLRLDASDRLRLQVAVADGKEIYSWAAATRFDSRTVFEMIAGGPVSTGAFGTELVDVFENSGVRFTFIGSRIEKERAVFRYDFAVPLPASHFSVRGAVGWITTGYHGWFEIDATSGNLLRLFRETDTTPPETRMCRNRTATEYGYMRIGDGEFLLASQSEFDVLTRGGGETRSMTRFANCHEYAVESSLSFDQQELAPGSDAVPKQAAPIPQGMSLTLALLAPIDTATAAAGDAVSARVTKAVRAPGSSEIMVDAGATVHGRVTQLRHQYSSLQFQIAIRYETLEQRGAVAPLTIELEQTLKAEQTRGRNRLATRATEFTLPPSSAAETGSWFAVPAGSGRYIVAAGSESTWITVAK